MRRTEAQTSGLRRVGLDLGLVRRPDDVAAIAAPLLEHLDHECVLVVACDAVGGVLGTVVVAEGQAERCLVPVREVMRVVLQAGGCAFALAHNHPSGNLTPSDEDIGTTRTVADAARVVGLRFLGHVVVAGDGWIEVMPRALRTPG